MYWCSSYPSCRSAVSSAWIWIVAVELNFTYEFACFSIVSTGVLTKCTIQQDDCVGRERGSAKTFQKFIHRIWEWIREGRETQRIVAESRWNEVRGEIRWVSLEVVVVFLMRSWNGWGGVYRKLLVKLRTNNEHSRARGEGWKIYVIVQCQVEERSFFSLSAHSVSLVECVQVVQKRKNQQLKNCLRWQVGKNESEKRADFQIG